ncbi:serine protease, partial [Staphylococcus felis]
ITMGDNLSMMLFNVIVAMILTVIEWVILVKFFKKRISLFDQVVLKDSTSKESGYTSHNDNTYLVGQNATTLTDLHPSGIIVLDNQRIDAVSEGSFIMKDTAVKIIEVEGTRVVVREQNSK